MSIFTYEEESMKRREEAQRLRKQKEERLGMALSEVLRSRAGRDVLAHVLERCHFAHALYNDPGQIALYNFGLELFEKMKDASDKEAMETVERLLRQ